MSLLSVHVGDSVESHTVFFVESFFLLFLLLNISGVDLGRLKTLLRISVTALDFDIFTADQ
jgi:hypothetical protein